MNHHPFGGEPVPPPAPKPFTTGNFNLEPMQIRVAKDGNSEFTVKGTPLSHFVAINPTLLDVKR